MYLLSKCYDLYMIYIVGVPVIERKTILILKWLLSCLDNIKFVETLDLSLTVAELAQFGIFYKVSCVRHFA